MPFPPERSGGKALALLSNAAFPPRYARFDLAARARSWQSATAREDESRCDVATLLSCHDRRNGKCAQNGKPSFPSAALSATGRKMAVFHSGGGGAVGGNAGPPPPPPLLDGKAGRGGGFRLWNPSARRRRPEIRRMAEFRHCIRSQVL